MAEPALFPVTPQSSPRRRLAALAPAGQHGVGEAGSQDLRRQQSVRFMGPCSVQPRGHRVNASRSSVDLDRRSADGQGEGGNLDPFHAKENRSDRRLGPPQRAPPPVPLPGVAASCLDALAAGDEYYTPEDDIASAPSSYRRLHRSRSMLTGSLGARPTQNNSARFLASGSLKHRPSPTTAPRRFFRSDPNDGQSQSSPQKPTLRAPKSMSFLSSRRSQSRSSASQHPRARDTTPSNLPELPEDGSSIAEEDTPRPRYKPSSLFGSLNRQSDLKIRKSLRGSSSTETSQETGSAPQQHTQEPGTIRLKARNASRSLRIKLKSLFAAARPEEEPVLIPCQHIEARRSHGTRLNSDDEAHNKNDCGLVRSFPAKVAIIEPASTGLVHSRKASLESLKSERDRSVSGASSLTSWVDSGPSTLTSQEQQQWREWEKQRLSVIREHGAHAPSPSMRRRALGSGVFQAPDSVGENAGIPRPIVDSQRIYSALVKRMNAMNTQASEDGERQRDTLGPGNTVRPPERSSSRTPDTIRRVSPGRKLSKAFDGNATPTRSSTRASVSRGRESWEAQAYHPPATPIAGSGYNGGMNSFSGRKRSTPVTITHTHDENAADGSDAVTQEDTIADWRPRLAGSPATHLFRTGSPFRRALRKSMQEEQNAWAEQRSATRQDHSLRSEYLPEPGSDSARNAEYSESVYSSDGSDSGRVKFTAESEGTSRVESPATYRPGGCREASTASSVEWKTWLSANIDKFEPPPSPPKALSVAVARPPQPRISSTRPVPSLRGHIREQADIHDDERDYCGVNNSSDDDDDDDSVLERVGGVESGAE
ncbi:hypothetical protein N658DRAFT_485569 [Parathielavia hyrcaniae]|uniref:Uncharacterized protein n=1 Tax=Parathielavia hyrcaniae TaxID=113614 RepID=A0AAN6Q249_9PEZI|nr:hypothetical protein N658DRAFT_485569 [Parathielavia hyrcaniae]